MFRTSRWIGLTSTSLMALGVAGCGTRTVETPAMALKNVNPQTMNYVHDNGHLSCSPVAGRSAEELKAAYANARAVWARQAYRHTHMDELVAVCQKMGPKCGPDRMLQILNGTELHAGLPEPKDVCEQARVVNGYVIRTMADAQRGTDTCYKFDPQGKVEAAFTLMQSKTRMILESPNCRGGR